MIIAINPQKFIRKKKRKLKNSNDIKINKMDTLNSEMDDSKNEAIENTEVIDSLNEVKSKGKELANEELIHKALLNIETRNLKKKNKHKHHKKHSKKSSFIQEGIDEINKEVILNIKPPMYPYVQPIINPGFISSTGQNIYNIPLTYPLFNPGVQSYPYSINSRIRH